MWTGTTTTIAPGSNKNMTARNPEEKHETQWKHNEESRQTKSVVPVTSKNFYQTISKTRLVFY